MVICKHTKHHAKKQYVLDQYKQPNNMPNYAGNNSIDQPASPPSPMKPPRPIIRLPADEGEVSAMDKIMQVNDEYGLYNEDVLYDSGDSSADPTLFEGDIVRTPHLTEIVEEMKGLSKDEMPVFDAINGGAWPEAEVPYVFGYGFRGQSTVYNAIAAFKKDTCITFRPKRSSDRNYVEFHHGGGCSSMIGRQGGRQKISLASGCLVTGIAIHEMMHALGFFHEQSRTDRDNYITIQWNNINRAMQYNFQKYKTGHASTLGEPYDKKSVMHYGNYAFSTNGRKTITSKASYNEVLGQRSGMSTIDKAQLNKYYKCSGTGGTGGGTGDKMKDKYAFCVSLSSWCSKDKFVSANCLKTCCKDSNEDCSYWSRAGYCKVTRYESYMKTTCPKSCGYC